MFGRGNWAILGLAKESLDAFKLNLQNQTLMATASQLAASGVARLYGADALGFNPFGAPRLDEDQELTPDQQAELAQFSITEREEGTEASLPAEILAGGGYAFSDERFLLHPSMPWYGLWAVANEWKKASDLASIKEQRSYVLLERPYRFLQSTDKKTVDQETLGATTIVRKQVPVLLDFNEGRVYIENTNKKLIYTIMVRLKHLGAEIIPVAWTYQQPNWTEEILNRLYEKTQYSDDFVKRAEEAKRFKPSEIEKLEDRALEAIVANYFSMTELPGGLWGGISGPATVRLHHATPPIAVKPATSATTLLHMTNDAGLVSGVLTIQRVHTRPQQGGRGAHHPPRSAASEPERSNQPPGRRRRPAAWFRSHYPPQGHAARDQADQAGPLHPAVLGQLAARTEQRRANDGERLP
ncbi:MAG: hypothetical protein QM757_00690 [Paludibaculum sp.]